MAIPRCLSGYWFCQEASEGRPLWFAAWRVGEPLAEAEEVEAGGGEDVAELDLRPAPIARAAQATAPDTAGEGALDPGAARIRLAERGGRLALTGGPERLELGARAQAQRPAGRAALRAAARGPTRARPAVLARELDPDQRPPGGVRALPPADAGLSRWARRLLTIPVEPESPHRRPERFFPTALLSQTAGGDRRVPPHAARHFHAVLAPYYAGAPERLCYSEYPDVGHDVPQTVADVMRRRMVDWFRRHLT